MELKITMGRVQRLRRALEEIAQLARNDHIIATRENALERFSLLNKKLVEIRSVAKTALGHNGETAGQ